MTARGWRWVVIVSVLATAAVGIAGGLDFVSRVVYPRHTETVECQNSATCRAFIQKAIRDALAQLTKGGGSIQSPNQGNQLPGGSPWRLPPNRSQRPLHP